MKVYKIYMIDFDDATIMSDKINQMLGDKEDIISIVSTMDGLIILAAWEVDREA
jgi:hypothetical protein